MQHVKGLELVPLPDAEYCCGFGGTFAVKMSEISGAMVTEKAEKCTETDADVLVGLDMGCLMNIGGKLHNAGSKVRVMHLAELLYEGVRRMMVHTAYGADRTVKQRSKQALQDEFLQRAVKFTTQRLKNGKQKAAEEHGNWEQWRERGRQIRLHTIAHLDYYLNLFADNARKHGADVYFAKDAADAASITREIVREKQAKTVVKSKSMVTEELHINQVLAEMDVAAIETDLGEYIIQLAQEPPSHIIIPAIHKNKQQIADLLSEEAGEKLEADTQVLAGFVRRKLREQFLSAEIGITGCNFAIAESGSIVIFENEGNARMVRPCRRRRSRYMGMERIIPSFEDLEVMATLLPRSATGQKLTAYMSGITGPAAAGRRGRSGGAAYHHHRQRPLPSAWRSGLPRAAELHPLRRMPERLPGVPSYRRALLRQHLQRTDRRGADTSAEEEPRAVAGYRRRFQSMRRLLGSLPSEDPAA